VTTKDIEEKLQTDFGITIDRHKIDLDRPIKESGEKEILLKLHHDVSATLKIEIKSSTPVTSPREESESTEAKPRAKRKGKPGA
jgi:large subunit ribosomal protein L9